METAPLRFTDKPFMFIQTDGFNYASITPESDYRVLWDTILSQREWSEEIDAFQQPDGNEPLAVADMLSNLRFPHYLDLMGIPPPLHHVSLDRWRNEWWYTDPSAYREECRGELTDEQKTYPVMAALNSTLTRICKPDKQLYWLASLATPLTLTSSVSCDYTTVIVTRKSSYTRTYKNDNGDVIETETVPQETASSTTTYSSDGWPDYSRRVETRTTVYKASSALWNGGPGTIETSARTEETERTITAKVNAPSVLTYRCDIGVVSDRCVHGTPLGVWLSDSLMRLHVGEPTGFSTSRVHATVFVTSQVEHEADYTVETVGNVRKITEVKVPLSLFTGTTALSATYEPAVTPGVESYTLEIKEDAYRQLPDRIDLSAKFTPRTRLLV